MPAIAERAREWYRLPTALLHSVRRQMPTQTPRADWSDLAGELDLWKRAGRTATLWWRDDDAIEATPAIERLLALQQRTDVPIAIAVVPGEARDNLEPCLAAFAGAAVLQHGWRHTNHQGRRQHPSEFGRGRELLTMGQDLRAGMRRLERYQRFLPVLVPPWNHIEASVVASLPALGFVGLSLDGTRDERHAATALRLANIHIDPMDWQTTGFLGETRVLGQAVRHLRKRRSGETDLDDPTGLMTHHLVHDEAVWTFVERFVRVTSHHPAVRWLDARSIFTEPRPAPVSRDQVPRPIDGSRNPT